MFAGGNGPGRFPLSTTSSKFPHPPRRGRNVNDVDFAEPNIPRNLRNFNPDLSSIPLTPQPAQEMVNAVAEELACAAAIPPAYKPYVAADYTAHPWHPGYRFT